MAEFTKTTRATYDLELVPSFGDLAQGQTDPIDLRSGLNPSIGAFQFTVPEVPTYGDAKLKRLRLQLHCDNLTMADGTVAYPKILGYPLRDLFNLDDVAGTNTEGSVSKTLDIPAVYAAHQRDSTHYMLEQFSGAGEADIVVKGDMVYQATRPYIHLTDVIKYADKLSGFGLSQFIDGHDFPMNGVIADVGDSMFTLDPAGGVGYISRYEGMDVIFLKDSVSNKGKMRPVSEPNAYLYGQINRPVPYFEKSKMEKDGVLRYAVQENHDYSIEENFYKEPIFDIGDTIIGLAKTNLKPVLIDDIAAQQVGLLTTAATKDTAAVSSDKIPLWYGGISVSNDGPTGSNGKSLHMFCHWANCVGSEHDGSGTGDDLIEKDYQDVFFCIKDIPAPLEWDVAGAYSTGDGTYDSMGTQQIEMDVKLTLPTQLKEIAASDDDDDGTYDQTAVLNDRSFIICFSENPPQRDDHFVDFFKRVTDDNDDFFGWAFTNPDSNAQGSMDADGRLMLVNSSSANNHATIHDSSGSNIVKKTWHMGKRTMWNRATETGWNGTDSARTKKSVVICNGPQTTFQSNNYSPRGLMVNNGDSFKIVLTYVPDRSGMALKIMNTDGTPFDNKSEQMLESTALNHLLEGVTMANRGTNASNWPSNMSIWLCNAPYNKIGSTNEDHEIVRVGSNKVASPEARAYVSNIKFKRQSFDVNNCTQVEKSFRKGARLEIPTPESIPAKWSSSSKTGNTSSTNITTASSYSFFGEGSSSSYTGTANTRAGVTVWAFGYDNASDIEASEKHMLLNGHRVTDFSRLTTPDGGVRLDMTDSDNTGNTDLSDVILAGYSSDQEKLGEQAQQATYETAAGDATKRGLTVGDSTKQIQMTGTNYCEFTNQKGIMTFDWDKDTDDTGGGTDVDFVKRECLFASTKVTKIISDNPNLVFEVHNPNVLNLDNTSNNQFRMYIAGETVANGNYQDVEIREIAGNVITVSPLFSGSGPVFDAGTMETNLSKLWISPKKYWVYMQFKNVGYFGGSPTALNSEHLLSGISYTAACMVSGTTLAGATYNESSFNDGAYTNPWSLDVTTINSAVHHQDYGFGGFNGGVGGHCMEMIPRIGNFTIAELFNVAQNTAPGEKLTLLTLLAANLQGGQISLEVDSDEDSTASKRPLLHAVYEDEKPVVNNFKVEPLEDNPQIPKFTWECSSEDAWYGMLFISDKQVESQYHNCIAHIPLNETVHGTLASGQTFLYRPDKGESFVDGSSSISGTVTATVESQVTGLQGYNKYFKTAGSDCCLQFAAGSNVTDPSKQMTISMHVVPKFYNSGSLQRQLLYRSGSYDIVLVSTTSNTYVKAIIDDSSGDSYDLRSNIILQNGDTPLHIAVTADCQAKKGNFKLYINGNLEDQEDIADRTRTLASNNNDILVGNDATSSGANGPDAFIEEIAIYNEAIHFVKPQKNEFILVDPLFAGEQNKNNNSGGALSYSTRLFVKDYHNIRGYTSDDVTCTPQIGLSKPSFNLSES